LVSELRQGFRPSQVDNRIRGEAVAVASPDDREAEALRQRQHLAVFAPAAVSVQLEGVNPISMGAQQRQERRIVPKPTPIVQIPIRMIENDKGLGALAQRVQQLSEISRRVGG